MEERFYEKNTERKCLNYDLKKKTDFFFKTVQLIFETKLSEIENI